MNFQIVKLDLEKAEEPEIKLPEIKPRQHIKKQRHYFANKSPSSQGYRCCFFLKAVVFPVVMYGCES